MKTQIRSWIYLLTALGFVSILNISCHKEDSTYAPVVARVYTTLDRTIVPNTISPFPPPIYAYEVSKYPLYGYGGWQYGPGLPYQKRMVIMPGGYPGTAVTKAANLLSFFTMSDIHLCDKETPAQVIFSGYKNTNVSCYSASMLLTTQVLNAAVHTINVLHKQQKFDFGISLGDDCNNTQLNELRWFIDVLDGKLINPDSGTKDDPIAGPDNDYQDEYQAEGLDKSVPWYQALGNHDHFWVGAYPANEYIRQSYTGLDIVNQGNPPDGNLNSRGYYMGSIDGRTILGDVFGAGAESTFLTPPQMLAADPNRRSLRRDEWIGEFFNTSSNPSGHGFSQSNVTTGFACYAFEPKADLPVRVIVLDDTQVDSDPPVSDYAHSSLDPARFSWLISELDKGQAEGKLMIIAAHIPVGIGKGLWNTSAPITEDSLLATLHHYPNLMLWISGHRHINAVTPQPSTDPAHPELGFWVVETPSLKDFPQEFRTFDIARNSDNSISIFATDVDPIAPEGSLPALSRYYAVAAYQLFNYTVPYIPSGAYNAELLKLLTPVMQGKIQNYGTTIAK
ncbi:MAG: TIGR03768 family metallophosphoesterase [Bacteroidetes bacterium]|nr:TIGR03768 family metallophosphoesterase [Bacteroidota bacterium]